MIRRRVLISMLPKIAERLDGAIMLPEVIRVRSVLSCADGDLVAAKAQLE